ncbi:NACHT, LRR and PYD domains-containing protein 3-like [Sinocyclocheilus rhinocerous]|uniref:NACHT, LRR and PYD domains-containing protein 3-like n=1 Tax=Sinocyclocheilus rhinocerous TaxID=307959 RepID=UPI0007BA6DAA|nr:PREDICTED: NACHT, LRR and PYD domains-containing protein 3-like [Sinocyclocheilus rhinocerous]
MNHTQTPRDQEFSPGCSSVHHKRSEPEPSCVFMKSDESIDHSQNISSVHQKKSEPEPSCVSMRSDASLLHLIDFKSDDLRFNLKHEVLNIFRSNLMKKFECLYEGTATQGNPTLLNEIYTELYITESESGEISNEHEVRQIETQSRRAATEDTAIKCNDIFRALPGQDKPIRTVLSKGVAGIGKTVSVQKFILDWAEGKENQDVQLIFPLPFREINLMKDKTLSLSDLLHVFFPETKEMEISSDEYEVLFIFDGLDECRLPLYFQRNETLRDKAVDEALQSKNGHLDLFLRFLLGLSVESHQILLQRIMTLKRSISDSNEITVEYIKWKIRTIDSPEKSINLFHCLNELGDHSLVEEIQQYLKSGNLSEAKLSSSQWAAVVFVLLTSEEELNEFRLDKFVKEKNKPEHMKVLQKLLPVIKESRSVQLYNCGITDEGCAALASALRSNPSHLRELNLSGNKLGDSVKLLSDVLQNPHCKLEKLRLYNCGIRDEGCAALVSALRSNPSPLRELDLSGNKLRKSEVKLLSDLKDDPYYKLETLYY